MPPEILYSLTPDWEAIRNDYANKALRVEDICVARGVGRRQLYRKLTQEGWPLRQPSRGRPETVLEEELAARLVAALDRKTRQFEKRLRRAAKADSAADSERDARTLGTLVRLFEKLTELPGSGVKPAKSRLARTDSSKAEPASTMKETHDQERLRGELARRLDTLRGQIGG